MALPQQESDSDREDNTTAAHAKWHIVALEQELKTIRLSKRSKFLEDLVAENDQHEELMQSLDSQEELVTNRDSHILTEISKDRIFSSFNELLCCLPWLRKKLFSDVKELNSILKEVTLSPGNISTLLTYMWSLTLTKEKIRDRDLDFLVTAYSWPAFLYKDYSFDSANIGKGLFCSTLLLKIHCAILRVLLISFLKAFKHVFTSPSSAKEIDGNVNGADVITAHQCHQSSENDAANRSHVANIIGMKMVTPCTIAYAACQLQYALSGVNPWRSVDGDFDYYDFYNNIVDFFKVVPGTDAQARITELLK
ncbi:hypothetical protein EDB19DRAFT_1831234 [Suillus lakei]|nr:hypothetical protein EDB19DRAFT_1831234 [Suillus lakei]